MKILIAQSYNRHLCHCLNSNYVENGFIRSEKNDKMPVIILHREPSPVHPDLPGYGYAKVPFSEKSRWAELMEAYFQSGRNIKMAFQLIDMRHHATEFDISMLDFMSQMGIPYTVVLTKSDKLNKTETANRLALIKEELGEFADGIQIIPFSAQKGGDAEILREVIENSLK